MEIIIGVIGLEGVLLCLLYGISYLLNQCLVFCKKLFEECKKFIFINGICFKCCGFKRYRVVNCKVNVQCDICREVFYFSVFYVDVNFNVGEYLVGKIVKSVCIQICGRLSGIIRFCVKIILVRVYFKEILDKLCIVYVFVDDQSSYLLVIILFFDFFLFGSMEY